MHETTNSDTMNTLRCVNCVAVGSFNF